MPSLVVMALLTIATAFEPARSAAAAEAETLAGAAAVIDGDTFRIGETIVRLADVDAPELAQTCDGGPRPLRSCGAYVADALVERVAGREVQCAVLELDQYDRQIARCDVSGEDLSQWLVSNGLAMAFRRYSDHFAADEDAARVRRGWACGRQASSRSGNSETSDGRPGVRDREVNMKAPSIGQSPTLFAIGVGAALTLFGSTEAAGQEKCKMSWDIPAANATYTGQHAFDAGDVPGHQVRIFEVRRTFPGDEANCEGLKQVEQWLRGYSDYVDRNGPAWGYAVTLLENGDKIFAEFSSAVQTVVSPDGSKKTEATTVHKWTGGTGKYQGVRGTQRESTVFDPEKNFNETHAEVEYWFEK
jgi:endonuclease YncB( thermonuclease family)